MRKSENKNLNELQKINNFIDNIGLDNVITKYDSKNGIASISGSKDGIQYTTVMTRQNNGIINTSSQFETNLGKKVLIEQIQSLRKQGFKQREVAEMLGISQSLVSKYQKGG